MIGTEVGFLLFDGNIVFDESELDCADRLVEFELIT